MKETTYLEIIDFSLNYFEKISAKVMGGGELYIKVYTTRTEEDIIKVFEENFYVKELHQTKRDPQLIEGDAEAGVEFLISFF